MKQRCWRFVIPLWAALIVVVVVGSLLSGASPVILEIESLPVSDKALHFAAYLALSLLPVLGLRGRRRAIRAALSMFLLGVALEAGQHFSPRRTVEFGDIAANGLGVLSGVLLGLPLRGRDSSGGDGC
jgi:hypothetical protein